MLPCLCSCWAFSATGAVEGAWAIARGQLVAVSEEELVQCDTGMQLARTSVYDSRPKICGFERTSAEVKRADAAQ